MADYTRSSNIQNQSLQSILYEEHTYECKNAVSTDTEIT